jgi:hypothetical protein
MPASTRSLLALSLLPPIFGVLSIAGVFVLLFRAVDDIPEWVLLLIFAWPVAPFVYWLAVVRGGVSGMSTHG